MKYCSLIQQTLCIIVSSQISAYQRQWVCYGYTVHNNTTSTIIIMHRATSPLEAKLSLFITGSSVEVCVGTSSAAIVKLILIDSQNLSVGMPTSELIQHHPLSLNDTLFVSFFGHFIPTDTTSVAKSCVIPTSLPFLPPLVQGSSGCGVFTDLPPGANSVRAIAPREAQWSRRSTIHIKSVEVFK